MYKDYNDYELLNYISENSEEANNIIYKKYEPLIRNIANKMIQYLNNSGVEIGDLVQEGMLGLSKAIESFRETKETLFYTYAKTCIERKMIDLVISTRRLKHRVLNNSISLEFTDEEGNEKNIEYLFKDNSDSPENILLDDEFKEELFFKASKVLTDLELQVFELKVNGFDYREIAEILDKDIKTIDNALQRIKPKIKKIINT